jgi:uncharacterized protein YhbP (UPF0306 family)
MNARDAIMQYLDWAQLMHLATFDGRNVWSASVYYAADNSHNIYWLSPPSAHHSKAIAKHSQVAASIAIPQPYGQPQRGVQLRGEAKQVATEKMSSLYQAYAERFDDHHRLQQILDGFDDHRLYQLKPTQLVLYDEEHYPDQPRQEWLLDGAAPHEDTSKDDETGADTDDPSVIKLH